MKCIVCGIEHDKDCCPVCGFPKIEFPGDIEEGLRTMKPTIDAYREDFLGQVSIGVMAYHWKDNNGALMMDRAERISIGTGRELRQGAKWLDEKFARIPDEQKLRVNLSVIVKGEVREQTAEIPNLMEAQLQQLGAELDEDMNIRLLLRNESASTRSEKFPLFR